MGNDIGETREMKTYIKLFEIAGNWTISSKRALCGTYYDKCKETNLERQRPQIGG